MNPSIALAVLEAIQQLHHVPVIPQPPQRLQLRLCVAPLPAPRAADLHRHQGTGDVAAAQHAAAHAVAVDLLHHVVPEALAGIELDVGRPTVTMSRRAIVPRASRLALCIKIRWLCKVSKLDIA